MPASQQSDPDAAVEDEERSLLRLYSGAADEAEAAGDEGAACFFLTQAWILALSLDAPEASALHGRLARHGRV